MYKQASFLNGAIMQLDQLPKSYCECWYASSGNKAQQTCKCGEESSRQCDWTWDAKENPTIKIIDHNSVLFHPVYSQGTSIVRGNVPLTPGRHHFWEIKMTGTVCGTDLMVGVGTDKVDLLANKYRFASALGLDGDSWGYSYRGISQHDNHSRFYGKKFGAGSIVSCHLDLFRGTLEFYLNRLPLGVAFHNLPVNGSCAALYPMVSSTAAKSSVKLLNSSSFPECLQYQAMRSISRYPRALSQLRKLPVGFLYKDQLWYLQQTEKFVYTKEAHQKGGSHDHLRDTIFEQAANFEGADENPASASAEEIDIYGDMDDDIMGILEQEQRRQRQNQQCHLDNNPESDEDTGDGNVEMVLFSYFCDHFA